jgi:hypothetical protein
VDLIILRKSIFNFLFKVAVIVTTQQNAAIFVLFHLDGQNEDVNAENSFTPELNEIDAGVNFTQNPLHSIEDNTCINSNAHTSKCQELTFKTNYETS